VIVSKIQKVPAEIMQKQDWPISFSMGVVTFTSPPSTADEILQISDDLMYAVKNSGKNGIKYEICRITHDHNKKS
jgi:PleD family two-component response regulator